MKTKIVLPALLSISLSISLFGVPALADQITEPSTGHAFDSSRNVDGKSYALLGTGVRKKFIIKVYAMGLYVDEADAKRAAAGANLGDGGQSFVASGAFGKLGVLHFVRSVDAAKIRDAYKDSLADALAGDLKPSAEAFIAAFDKDVKEGEEIHIRTGADGSISVSTAGSKKSVGTNPKLAQAIWNIWLGAKPISSDMKKGLVERIAVLK